MGLLTFKDLKKRVTTEIQQQSEILEVLGGKPFWIWDMKSHKSEDVLTSGNCCFNHIIGLPRKNGMEMQHHHLYLFLQNYFQPIFSHHVLR